MCSSDLGARDDVPLSRLPKMARLIDRLVRRGRLSPGIRNLWITEYGYETNPPVEDHLFTPGDQARFLPWAEYLAQSVPTVRSFAQFLLRDLPPGAFRVGKSGRRAFGQWQSGLLFEDGTPKLGAHSFRTGLFVKQRLRDRKLTLFGRLRLAAGPRTVRIERRPSGTHAWRTVLTKAPGADSAESRFTIDGRDAFLRFGYGTGRNWRYRVVYLDGTEWRGQAAPSVAPVIRR